MGWLFGKKDKTENLKPTIVKQKIKDLYDEGFTISEIAEELNLNPKQITNYLDRDKRKKTNSSALKEFLEDLKAYREFEEEIREKVRKEIEEQEDDKPSPLGEMLVKALQGGMSNAPNTRPDRRAPNVLKNDTQQPRNNTPEIKRPRGRPRKE